MIGTSPRWRSWRQTSRPSMSGQAEIEEDEVVSGRRQGVGPGGDVGDLMAVCPQARHERLGDRPVVLDEQQLHPLIVEDGPTA